MTGWNVCREPNGVRIYKEGKEIFLDQDECNKLAKSIWHAQREYWLKLCEGKFRNPYSKRFLHRTKRMVKVYAGKHGVSVEELDIAFAESLIPKHAFVGLKTYADICREIERLAKEIQKAKDEEAF